MHFIVIIIINFKYVNSRNIIQQMLQKSDFEILEIAIPKNN